LECIESTLDFHAPEDPPMWSWPTARNPNNVALWLLQLILSIGIIALVSFVVGPQSGSIDDDRDGNPDIPIVVMSARAAKDLSSAAAIGHLFRAALDSPASGFVGDGTCHVGDSNRSETNCLENCWILRFSCLLRC
jgi:hypothetical protein